MTEHKQKIRDFLNRHFQNHTFEDDEDIFASNFVNSLFAMQLVLFVEQEFRITIDNEDLDIDNFRTISTIAAFVERKATSAA
ncbi:MAG TPA: phosphopantetheine-binding protein [Herpetosiphonaceae bacterium]